MTNYCVNIELKLRLTKASTGTYAISDADLTLLCQQATQLAKSLIRARGVTPPSTADSEGILTQLAIEIGVAFVEGSFWVRAGDVQTVTRAMPLYVRDMIDGYIASVKSVDKIISKGSHSVSNYETGF